MQVEYDKEYWDYSTESRKTQSLVNFIIGELETSNSDDQLGRMTERTANGHAIIAKLIEKLVEQELFDEDDLIDIFGLAIYNERNVKFVD